MYFPKKNRDLKWNWRTILPPYLKARRLQCMLDVHRRITQLPTGRWGDVRHVPIWYKPNEFEIKKNDNNLHIYIYSSHPPLKPQIKLFRLNPTKGIKISQTTNVGHRWSQELLQLPMWAGTYSTCGDSMHLFKLVYCIKNDGFFIESSSL